MKPEESTNMHDITPASDARPVIVLLGGPGSGKGTHGQTLARALGFQHLSSGEHFRDHIRRATPLGLRAQDKIEAGQLVPDEMAVELVREMIGSSPEARGFVLDGYPRSLAQAEALQVLASELGIVIAKTVFLQVSDEEIVRRLSGRLTCRACGATCHETFKPPALPGVCDPGQGYRKFNTANGNQRRRSGFGPRYRWCMKAKPSSVLTAKRKRWDCYVENAEANPDRP